MTVRVHFSGPSYTRSVVLQPGAPPVDVGRDAQAGVYLPDQDRLISRRHFTLEWAEGGARVTVLSKVNGITTPRGEVGVGQSTVLAPGESGQLGCYSFQVEAAAAADPWAAFASDWVPPGAASRKERPTTFPDSGHAPLNRAFDDAFSSSTAWRVEEAPDPLASASFESEKVIGQAFALPADAAPSAAAPDAAALRALCRGLGIGGPAQLGEKDWEQVGRSIRQVVQGLADLMQARAEVRREMRAADRTMLGAQDGNPLKDGMPIDELLHYLLFMPQGAAGQLPVQRALEETIAELRAHEFASLAAVRAVVEGSIKEFEPGKLRSTLMQGKRSIAAVVDNARLWDLYATHYQQKGEHMADWLAQVFDRHFMPAYAREAERLRREGQPAPPERRN